MFNFGGEKVDELAIRRKWNQVKIDKALRELENIKKEDIKKPIKLTLDKKMYKMQWFNLFVVIAFLFQGVLAKDVTSLVISLCYELGFAPFRMFLDTIFNSYKRIIGVCVYMEDMPAKSSKSIDKTEVHIAWHGKNSAEVFRVEQTNELMVGDRISIIKGKLSRKVTCVETKNIELTN